MVENSKRLKCQNGLSGRCCFELLIDPAISEMKIVLLVCLDFQIFHFRISSVGNVYLKCWCVVQSSESLLVYCMFY